MTWKGLIGHKTKQPINQILHLAYSIEKKHFTAELDIYFSLMSEVMVQAQVKPWILNAEFQSKQA